MMQKKKIKKRIGSFQHETITCLYQKYIYEFLILLTSTNGYTQESNH